MGEWECGTKNLTQYINPCKFRYGYGHTVSFFMAQLAT